MEHRRRTPKAESALRALRQSRTFTQGQMAELLHVTQQTYSRYENGKIEPASSTKARIAAFLGVSVSLLWPKKAGPRSRTQGTEARV